MSTLRDDLMRSYETGNFLEAVYNSSLVNRDEGNALTSELAALHNEGLIDVVAAFEHLKSKSTNGPEFFLTRHIFEKVLPHLDAPTPSVMRCVLQLYRDAGQDLAAGMIFDSYIGFCAKDPARPQQALKEIETNPDKFADLLTATIVAGSRIENSRYVAEAIRLTKDKNIEIRRRAVFSMGKLHWPEDVTPPDSAFSVLEQSTELETDDQVLGGVLKSAFALLQRDKAQETRIIALIDKALSKGNEYAIHAASELFGFQTSELSASLLDVILGHLKRVAPTNKGTLDYIDQGISRLLKSSQSESALRFLEDMLLAYPNQLTLQIFDSAARDIRGNNALMSKVLTRWFLRGDRVLCDGVHTIVGTHHGDDLQLEIDPAELNPADLVHILFLARKAIGYLLLKPISAATILISLMRHSTDDEVLAELGALLFDPLLLNFTGKARDYVVRRSGVESGKVKATIDNALKAVDDYLKDLRSVGQIPALWPSEAHRETYNRHFSRLIAESYKAAEAKSVFLNLISKSILLYGRKSIDYVYGPDGEANRIETPLQSHGTELEFPRMENIDPYGLDHMLRVFRVARLRA